jgi:hypothetical protein
MGREKFKEKFPSFQELNFLKVYSGFLPPLEENNLFFPQIT